MGSEMCIRDRKRWDREGPYEEKAEIERMEVILMKDKPEKTVIDGTYLDEQTIDSVKVLLGNAKTEEALDYLLQKIPKEESSLYNQVIIQKSRYMENQHNKLNGVDYSSTINMQVISSLLQILEQESKRKLERG